MQESAPETAGAGGFPVHSISAPGSTLQPGAAGVKRTSSVMMTTQALLAGAATADFDLPFLLAIDPSAAEDVPRSGAVFTDLLQDLFTEPLHQDRASAAIAGSTVAQAQVPLHAGTTSRIVPGAPPPTPSISMPVSSGGEEGGRTAGMQEGFHAIHAAKPQRQASSASAGSMEGSGASSGATHGGGAGRRQNKSGKSADAVQRRAAVQKRYREKKVSHHELPVALSTACFSDKGRNMGVRSQL